MKSHHYILLFLLLIFAVTLCSHVLRAGKAVEPPGARDEQRVETVGKRLESAVAKIWAPKDDNFSAANTVQALAKWHQTKEEIIATAVRRGEISVSEGNVHRLANAKQELRRLLDMFEKHAEKLRDWADSDHGHQEEGLAAAPRHGRHGPPNNPHGVKLPAFEYAKMIEPELGIPPVVDLTAGVEIPIYVDGQKYVGDPGIHCCDSPSLQMGDCMSGSCVQRYEGQTREGKPLPHVVWVSFGRHDGRGNIFKKIDEAEMVHAVVLIGYNKHTGATAFFETGDNRKWVRIDPKTNRMTGVLPGIDDPRSFNQAYATPGSTQCVECHQSDPFIHNSFIDGARHPEDPSQPVVPEIAGPDTPYYVIGGSFWDMRTIHIEGNSCFECHRIGMRTIEDFIDDGWRPEKHVPTSDLGSLKEDFESLLRVWIEGPENTPDAEWIIPPAGDAPRRVVGEDYPFKAKFNRPHIDAIRKLHKKPLRIPEPRQR